MECGRLCYSEMEVCHSQSLLKSFECVIGIEGNVAI